jgi:hypothetical protein
MMTPATRERCLNTAIALLEHIRSRFSPADAPSYSPPGQLTDHLRQRRRKSKTIHSSMSPPPPTLMTGKKTLTKMIDKECHPGEVRQGPLVTATMIAKNVADLSPKDYQET